jgi:RNA polymerase sigma-70 factor (ECF subfamily)
MNRKVRAPEKAADGAKIMDTSDNERLTRIETLMSTMKEAQGEGDAAVTARQQLVLLYYGAVYRYLMGMLRDPAVAADLAQEFAVRFMRGDFLKANLQRGRFRYYLKTALRNMVNDHWRKVEGEKAKGPQPLTDSAVEAVAAEQDTEAELDRGLRDELLARTWAALARVQESAGKPYYAVLRGKTENPQLRTAQLAEQLGAQLGKTFSEANMRQLLHRARDKFADLLLDEVARSLGTTALGELEQELLELELLDYCRSALERRKRSS